MMTFTEAAVEVLRLVGRPLHYKEITEIAIEKNLLSHVGKTPEITMSARLATMVRKDRGEAPIIKVKPGVFGLRDFSSELLSDAVEAEAQGGLSAFSDAGEEEMIEERSFENAEPASSEAAVVAEVPSEKPAQEEAKTPNLGFDVFPEEDDDDEPILSKLDTPAPAAAASEDGEGRRRRRRRRRRRGGQEGGEGERGSVADHADAASDLGEEGADELWEGEDDAAAPAEAADSDLIAKDLADAIETVLDHASQRALSWQRLAEILVRRGRLAGDIQALTPTIVASVRGDIARRTQLQMRSRFRVKEGRVALTMWQLPGETLRTERELERMAEKQREGLRRAFLRRLGELPTAGFLELIAAWLSAEGVVGLRALRRPGSRSGDFHLAGTLRSRGQDLPLAIVLCKDASIGREHVIEVRGALHHYGPASLAWIVTLGSVRSGAREEAATAGLSPCALFDGSALARAMEAAGVGMRSYTLKLSDLDFELFEELEGGRPAERSERPAERSGRNPETREGGRDSGRERGRSSRFRNRDRQGGSEEGGRSSRRDRRGSEAPEELEPKLVEAADDLPDEVPTVADLFAEELDENTSPSIQNLPPSSASLEEDDEEELSSHEES